MQKFLKIAEQQVQWLALGLGALYLLYMGWSYGYQSDITVTLGTQRNVEPGEIDAMIVKNAVTPLETQINKPDPITIVPPDVVATWTKRAADQSNLSPIAAVMTGNPTNPDGGIGLTGPEAKTQVLAKAPSPPALIPVAIASYRTLVQYPDPAFNPAAAPADAAGAAPAVAPMITKDIDAVSVKFKNDMTQLAKAFSDAFPPAVPPAAALPPEIYQTMYLRITLFRSEQDENGKWGTPTEIKSLKINPLPEYPGEKPTDQDGTAYLFWARDNQELILHPPFYTTVPGADPWIQPAGPVVAPAGNAGGVGAAGGAGAVPGGPGAARALPQGFNPNVLRPGFALPGGGGVFPGVPRVVPQPGEVGGGAVAAGLFNPLVKANDDFIIAHDETVEPERTYRYYIQYKLSNPLWGNRLAVKPLIDQFALISPRVDENLPASDAITIPSRTQIFVTNPTTAKGAHFSVFSWSPNIKETQVPAEPGDAIGLTRWTLVDIRQDPLPPKGYYAVLVDNEGHVQRHYLSKDTVDPQQKEYHDKAQAAAAAAAAAAPAGPGVN